MNPLDLTGRHIVVTGSSGFLASQFVPFLGQMGATVHAFDLKADAPVDITDPDSVNQAVARILKEHGSIHGVVHAAALDAVPGVSSRQFAPYESFDKAVWDKEFAVNIGGMQLVTQAVAPHLMKEERGSVVFIASDLALIAPNNSLYEEGKFKDIAYVATKAGVLGLMRAWASYFGRYDVRANALVPGGMRNAHTDEFAAKAGALSMLGRMAQPGEYNAAVAFLLADASSYMTGSSLIIDGGRTAM